MLRRNGLSELDHGALAIVLIALSGFPTLLAAQPARFAVDVSVGSGGGIGGRYGDRGQYDGAITIATGGRSLVVAANASVSETMPLGAVSCMISGLALIFSTTPPPECPEVFPDVTHIALLSGLQRTRSGRTVRAMIGPARFRTRDEHNWGALAQLDVARGFRYVEFVGAIRSGAFVRRTGERLGVIALDFGVRIRS